SDRALGEGNVLGGGWTAAGLRHKLRTEHVEVFDLSHGTVNQGAKTRFAGAGILTEARNLPQLRISSAIHNQVLRAAGRNLRVEQSRFGKVHGRFGHGRPTRANRGVGGELR